MPTLDMTKSQVFFRDRLVPFEKANLSIASSSVLYGLSVYTVFGANWNSAQKRLCVFRHQDHYRRLVNSARIMDFDSFESEWPYEKFESAMLDLLRQNDPRQDVLVRVSVFVDELAAGTKIHGLRNSLSAYIYPAGQLLPAGGASVCVSSWTRTPDNAIPSRAKVNGSYANASLMKNEALLNGYDDAISLDSQGHVAEGSVANIFLIKDGALVTPDSATDILEGITRDTIINLARHMNIPIEVRSVDRSELYTADEAFFCGSSVGVTPILSIDHRPVGRGVAGELTAKIAKTYDDCRRGKLANYTDWCLVV